MASKSVLYMRNVGAIMVVSGALMFANERSIHLFAMLEVTAGGDRFGWMMVR